MTDGDTMTDDTMPGAASTSGAAASAPYGAPPPVDGPSRESRAATAFFLVGIFGLVASLFVVGSIFQTARPVHGIVALAGAWLGMLATLAAAFGLTSGRRWAIAVATPMLALMVILGFVEVIVAFTHNTLQIPIGAFVAMWALRAPFRTPIDPIRGAPRPGIAGVVVLGAMLLATGWPLVSPVLLVSGGPLIVAEDALQPNLVVTCDGAPGSAPATITVAYDWRWSRAEPFAGGLDSVALAAYTTVEDGEPAFAIDSIDPATAGIWQSEIMIFEPLGVVFGINLADTRFEPASVSMHLISVQADPPAHGSVLIQATYLHEPADTSRLDSPATWTVSRESTCEW
jgi:hypothetical protein